MSNFEFKHPSDKATSRHSGSLERKYNFPFDTVPVGMSFEVTSEQVKNIGILRTMASRQGTKLNRKFRVINHTHCYEVFCESEND